MSKYLDIYNLNEKWETFKNSNVHTVLPLIDEVERLTQTPTEEQIKIVRQLEHKYQHDIKELEDEDQYVLEDMITRVLYQAYLQVKDSYTRWNFTLERASDKGFENDFEQVDGVILEAQESMRQYSSSGNSPEEYAEEQKTFLNKLDTLWENAESKLKRHASAFYQEFLTRQVQRKREVIQRHIEHFQDNTFGEWMRSMREEKGWSLARAAEVTGVSSSYLHRIERGTRGVPSVKKLEQLAKGYDIPHSEVIIMASGEVKPVDTYIQEGAFQLKGNLADKKQKHAIAELIRMVVEDEMEEATKQMKLLRNLIDTV